MIPVTASPVRPARSGLLFRSRYPTRAGQWLLRAGFANGKALDALGDETRDIQPGRGYLFDGVDDLVSVPDTVAIQDIWDGGGKVRVLLKASNAGGNGAGRVFQKGSSKLSLDDYSAGASRLDFRVTFSGDDRRWKTPRVIQDGVLYQVEVEYNADTDTSVPIIRIDGTEQVLEVVTAGTGTRISDAGTDLTFGNHPGGAYGWHGLLAGLEMYNQGTRRLRLVCDEAAGTTAYDSSGSGNHGAVTNASPATFHATDADIPESAHNEVGYSEGGGGVLIPRDESDPIKDVLGNPLDHSGRVRYHADLVQSHCAAFDGVDDKITFADIPTGAVICSSQGAATPTIDTVNDEITFTAGTCWNLMIEDSVGQIWAWLPLQEGAGTTGCDVSGNANHGTLVNITAGSFWGTTQSGTDNDSHWNLTRGFRDAAGVKIPALAEGSAAADGNAITNPADKGHNGAETKLRMTTLPPALKDSTFWAAARGYGDIAADYGAAQVTMARILSTRKADLLTFGSTQTGRNLELVREYLDAN